MWAKYKVKILVAVIVFLIGVLITLYFLDRKLTRDQLRKQDQNTAAMFQDFKKTVEDGNTQFKGKVIEGTPRDISETAAFQQMDEQQKHMIEEMAKVNNILSAMETNMRILTERVDKIPYSGDSEVTDSTVTFPKGYRMVFQDTAGAYQFREYITFSDSIVRDFRSLIKLEPVSLRFTRNRDKSIDGNMSFGPLENSQIELQNTVAFYIPSTDKQRKYPKLFKVTMITLKWMAYIGVPSLTYYAGVKTGISIR